ncbi:MAG: hypothetical protein QNJ90_12955 [Planctomycetota bacterium]|nr:hypothetical protein [Planctomycetota bacterium]
MSEEGTRGHPVDYEVHPKAGIVFLVWGAIHTTGSIWRDGLFSERAWPNLAVGLGLILYGAAMRTPAGRARRWLVRGWLGTIVAIIALALFSATR